MIQQNTRENARNKIDSTKKTLVRTSTLITFDPPSPPFKQHIIGLPVNETDGSNSVFEILQIQLNFNPYWTYIQGSTDGWYGIIICKNYYDMNLLPADSAASWDNAHVLANFYSIAFPADNTSVVPLTTMSVDLTDGRGNGIFYPYSKLLALSKTNDTSAMEIYSHCTVSVFGRKRRISNAEYAVARANFS